MAKFNFNPLAPRGAHARWTRDGDPTSRPHLILAASTDDDAETLGEERIESFNEMPPYLQRTILSVKDTALRGRLMDDQDLAETYYQYGRAAQQLRGIDPDNRLLNAVRSPDWLPSDNDVAELQAAVQSATAPATARPGWPQSEEDVGRDLGPDTRSQISFKDGVEVTRGTAGSVRPDFIHDGVASFEVKNYDIANNAAALIRRTADQAIQRAEHLPEQLIQRVIIDIRGQTADEYQQQAITERIVKRSKGIISADSIDFMGGNQ